MRLTVIAQIIGSDRPAANIGYSVAIEGNLVPDDVMDSFHVNCRAVFDAALDSAGLGDESIELVESAERVMVDGHILSRQIWAIF